MKLRNLWNLKLLRLINLLNYETYETFQNMKLFKPMKPMKPLNPWNLLILLLLTFRGMSNQLTCGVINLGDAWYFWPPDSRARIYVFEKRSVLDIDRMQKKLIKKNDQFFGCTNCGEITHYTYLLRSYYLRGYPKAKGDKKEKERGQKEKLERAKRKQIKFGLCWLGQ